jgi:hypothetical protein
MSNRTVYQEKAARDEEDSGAWRCLATANTGRVAPHHPQDFCVLVCVCAKDCLACYIDRKKGIEKKPPACLQGGSNRLPLLPDLLLRAEDDHNGPRRHHLAFYEIHFLLSFLAL